MPNVIVPKRSSTASAVPSAGSLATGEIAINLADKKLFVKDHTGTVVELTGAAGGASITAGSTPPTSPAANALWWDSESGKLKIYYTDADGSQWVDAMVGTVGSSGSGVSTGKAIAMALVFGG